MNARVLLVDNHDSFTFNLVQALRVLGAEVLVRTSDVLCVAEARALAPTHVLLSPGPGTPARAGCTLAVLEAFLEEVPILGVCLGHQAIGAFHGGGVVRATRPVHGEAQRVFHDGHGWLRGLPSPMEAGRYHSLVVTEAGLSSELVVSAWTVEGEVMGLRHRALPVEGVQFHPESLLTPRGDALLAAFLRAEPARPRRALPREEVRS